MKLFKIIALFSITVISFYYTDKIVNNVLENNDLYQQIYFLKDDYFINSVPAFIEDKYIIPGINGQKVNVKKSFFNMKSFKNFNDNYLLYEPIEVNEKLINNKDKIIKRGNGQKNSISFILEQDDDILSFFQNNHLNADYLITLNSFKALSFFEQINNDNDNYYKVESLLNNNSLNKDLCVILYLEKTCRNNKKYLIEPTVLTNNNVFEIKNNISSGDIILIKKGTKKDYIDSVIQTIKFKDINIVVLSDLLSEKR